MNRVCLREQFLRTLSVGKVQDAFAQRDPRISGFQALVGIPYGVAQCDRTLEGR
jgi:hypothetical protein